MFHKIRKIMTVIYRVIIKLTVYINNDFYMHLYNRYLKSLGVKVIGKPKFIAGSAFFDGTDYSLIEVGNDVVISREVLLLTHDFSISRGLQRIGKLEDREVKFLDGIKIGDNTFIGARVTILPGTEIGKNCIIGACTVVKGEIPDDSIVVGNPGRIIGNVVEWASCQVKDPKWM